MRLGLGLGLAPRLLLLDAAPLRLLRGLGPGRLLVEVVLRPALRERGALLPPTSSALPAKFLTFLDC